MAQDPYNRTVDRDAEPPELLRQKVINRAGYVPGVGSRQDLDPALDTFGRPIENPRQGIGAFFTPRVGQPKNDPLAQVFIDARIQPGDAPDEIEGVALTTPQKRAWLTARGKALQQKQSTLTSAGRMTSERREEKLRAELRMAGESATATVRRTITSKQRADARKKAG